MLRRLLRRAPGDAAAALRAVIGDHELPSFPAVVMKVLAELRRPGCDASSVERVLALDPGLSVQVLRAVNSAAFGLRRRVESVAHGVALLGLGEVEAIVLAAGVAGRLPASPAPGFEPARFWGAAARRAVLARELANLLHPARRAESFTAGLLQDMAIPVLCTHRPDDYGPVAQAWHRGELDCLVAAEREALDGVCHGLVGSLMCDRWALPESLAASVTHHHAAGDDTGCPPAVALTAHLAETPEADRLDALVAAASDRFGLPADEVAGAVARAEEEAAGVARLLV